MRTAASIWLIAAGFAVSGCAGVESMSGKAATCTGPVCNVTIHVADCSITDPGRLYVKGRGRHEIIWKLDAGNHDFTAGGITFETGQGTVFTGPRHPSKGVFTMVDNNNAEGVDYKYRIDVRTDDGRFCSKDPDVLNN